MNISFLSQLHCINGVEDLLHHIQNIFTLKRKTLKNPLVVNVISINAIQFELMMKIEFLTDCQLKCHFCQ